MFATLMKSVYSMVLIIGNGWMFKSGIEVTCSNAYLIIPGAVGQWGPDDLCMI